MKKMIILFIALVVSVVTLGRLTDYANGITKISVPEGREVASFAAGCFWCTESLFQELDGVDSVVSGYAGGTFENPTYEDVISNKTDHREAVQIIYDPQIVSYEDLLDQMLKSIDPTDDGGQFVDRGFSYTTAIYYHDSSQKKNAEVSLKNLELNEKIAQFPVVTEVLPYTTFYEAEEYHQDFYIKSPERYKNYADFSGRDALKEFIWGEISSSE